jgi:anaerobic magnesium-protoporphyrin IX monomethyl ester cyclase
MRKLVLIINPPNSNTVLDGAQCTVTRPDEHTDWSNFPSLGVLTLASALADLPGVVPVYIDGTVIPWTTMISFIERHADRLLAVCASVLTASYEAGIRLLETAKAARRSIWTIVGNDHITALPEQCLRNQRHSIDFGFVGNEVVSSFRALIADLRGGAPVDVGKYPGIVALAPHGLHRGPLAPEPVFTAHRHDLIDAELPHTPSYDAHFQARIAPRMREMLGISLRRGVPLELGRGCIKFRDNDACSFCSIQFGGLWRNELRSAEEAWSVIQSAWSAGYDYFYVTADELPLTFGGMLNQMHARAPTWWSALPERERPILVGYARADGLSSPRLAANMHRIGFRQLMLGLDAGLPVSLAAMNKPLSPLRRRDQLLTAAERMFEHNVQALRVAREEGIVLKVGFVVGHLGMTRALLRANVEQMRALLSEGRGAIASLDVEVLSPEPGSLDYACLVDVDMAERRASALGLTIAPRRFRAELAEEWRSRDVIDREQAMSDYIQASMPELNLDDLAKARAEVRAHAKQQGIVVGEG